MSDKDAFKAANYGEVLAVINDLELVSFEESGDYQGEYLAVLKDKTRLFYFTGSYGSCSSCDWLEDVKNWKTDMVPYKEAVDYCANIQPMYIVPLSSPLKFKKVEHREWKLEGASNA